MRTGGWLLLAGFVVAAPIIAEVQRAATRPRPELAVESALLPADSVTLAARFRPTVDSHGDTVAGYLWRLFAGRAPRRVLLARGYARLDTMALESGRVVIRWRVAKAPAPDTAWISYSLRAVDSHGIPSAEVYSAYAPVAWPPPDPRIYPWNYDSLSAYLPNGASVGDTAKGEQPVTFEYIAETVRVCYLAWYGARSEVPRFRVAGTTNDPAARRVERVPDRADCLAITALEP